MVVCGMVMGIVLEDLVCVAERVPVSESGGGKFEIFIGFSMR